jgi:hypothetical protein
MNAHVKFKADCRQWRGGRISDRIVLRNLGQYLHATGDWIAVRDFLIEMAMSSKAILDWFAEQDFPDFRQAVEEGWGWPEDYEE